MPEGAGDAWTWVAIDRDYKLVPAWLVGKRTTEHAAAFMTDLASSLGGRTPAQASGISRFKWDCRQIAELLDDRKYADSFHFQGAKARI